MRGLVVACCENSSGRGGMFGAAGIGLGMGARVGNQFAQNLDEASAQKVKCTKCGASVKAGMKFCQNCGAKKPEGAPLFRCDKCGWEPEDPTNPPKFCPECGDIFDDNDKK